LSYEDAMALMLRRRPTANPIPEFRALLQEFAISKVIPVEKGTSDTTTTTPDAKGKKGKEETEVEDKTKPVEEDDDPSAPTNKRVATAMIGPQRPPKR
jgi:hypothetical protein